MKIPPSASRNHNANSRRLPEAGTPRLNVVTNARLQSRCSSDGDGEPSEAVSRLHEHQRQGDGHDERSPDAASPARR